MKKLFNVLRRMSLLVMLLCTALYMQAQTAYLCNQQFSSKIPSGWSVQPTASAAVPSWKPDTGIVVSAKYAMHCNMPFFSGDTAELVTPFFDCTKYKYVQLRFAHICKVFPSDICEIQYQEQGLGSNYVWKTIPTDAYRGNASTYKTDKAFSHASYDEWEPDDSTAQPANTWWKEEIFSLENYAGYSTVRFRFIIRRGPDNGSFIAAGWYVDDFRVIGSSAAMEPPVVEFTSHLNDTVFGTGPFVVEAKVATRSDVGIVNPWLVYSCTYEGKTLTDSVKMTATKGDSLWKASIPQQYYGTTITYSILGRDSAGNSKKISASFVNKRIKMGKLIGYTYYCPGDTTGSSTNNSMIIYYVSNAYSRSRSLYLASEINPQKVPMTFSKLAWYLRPNSSNAGNVTVTRNLKIWMLATDDITTSAAYMDPDAMGATLVYDDTTVSKVEWNEVSLSRPFSLPAGKNLYIFYEGVGGTTSSTVIYWAAHSESGRCVYTSTGTGTWNSSASVPLIRLGVCGAAPVDSSSVALASIDTPQEGTVAGVQPVKVTIQNVGDGYLKSCDVNWAVNGVLQTPKAWKGNLYCDFYDTLTLGSYTQKAMDYDTITVWVSNPNNVKDSVTDDDTLTVIPFGCSGSFAGTYTVGRNDATHQYNFPDLASAIKLLKLCGTKGDVTLQLASGVYTDKLSINGLNFAHRLEITSLAGHADSVVFRPKSGPVVSLNNCSGLTFSKITFDARKARTPFYCVQMNAGLNDIEFSHCTLYGFDTNVNNANYSVIYRGSGNPIHNIRFIGNEILGGSYGVYFYGSGTNARNSNIVFDSNHIANYYSYSGYFYYNNNLRFTHNRIDRARTGFYYNYGCLLYYNDSSLIDANKVHIRNNNTTQYGLRVGYSDSLTIVSNNEVMMRNDTSYSSATTYGMYVYYNYGTKVYNNSVLVSGTCNTQHGIYSAVGSTAYSGTIKNNIAVCEGTGTTYPYYLNNANYVSVFDVDYNCWWSPKNVSYVGAAKTTLAAHQSSLKTAVHDLYMHPVFADTTVSLLPGDFSKLDCPNHSEVPYDIDGIIRVGTGVRGCYTDASAIVPYNGMLVGLTNIPNNVNVGDTICPSVVLRNGGAYPLTEASILWEWNNVVQGNGLSWKGTLAVGESDTIPMGCIVLKSEGEQTLMAYLTGIGSHKDSIAQDDTTSMQVYVCKQQLNGDYTIGPKGDFATVSDALRIIGLCGMSGDVTLKYFSGTYAENIRLSDLNPSPYRLTITSMAGSADSVIIHPKSGVVVNMSNVEGVTFKRITLDGSKLGTYCVQMGVGLNDIEFNHCKIIGFDTNVSNTAFSTVYRGSGTPISNIRFIGNEILGGSYGVYMYGSSSTARNNHILFDSNYFAGYYAYSAYFYYNRNLNILHNRSDGARSGYNYDYGMYVYYADSSLIDANRFRTYNRNKYQYGPRICYTDASTIVSNNEVVLYNDNTTCYGIYIGYNTNTKIINNSVLVYGKASTQYGIYVYGASSSYSAEFKNNMAVCNGTSTVYPFYLSSASYVSNFTLDYNCWWSPKNVSYAGAAKTTLAAHQTSFTTAVHDMYYRPDFVDTSASLKLSVTAPFDCPRYTGVNQDIIGINRDTTTTMGAYTKFVVRANGSLTFLYGIPATTEITDTLYPSVVLLNSGIDTLTEASIRVSVDGVVQGNDFVWKGSLANMESDTVALRPLVLRQTGRHSVSVYLVGLGQQVDGYSGDDTVKAETFTCYSQYAGVITVGANGRFKTISAAIDSLMICGMGGPVTLSILPGKYAENLILTAIPGASSVNTLTITSSTGDSTDVVWLRADNPKQTTTTTEAAPLVFNGAEYVIVRNITLSGLSVIQDEFASSHGIVVIGRSHDIEVSNCHLYVPKNFTSTVTSHNHSAVYIYSGGVRNIRVHNSLIEGGATGCYVYGSSTTDRVSNVAIENNEIGYIDYSALYAYYTDSLTFSGNKAVQRRSDFTPANAYMVYTYYTNANIIGNRFDFIGLYYGFYLGYFGNVTKGFYTIANNEVRGTLTNSTGYGVYVTGSSTDSVHLDFIHNTLVYDATGSTAYGFYAPSQYINRAHVKNNIIHMRSTSAGTVYPMYISSTNYLVGFDIDYNCFYNEHATKYVGYAGGAKSTISAWQSTVTTDKGSVFQLPKYVNINRDASIYDSTGISCPRLAGYSTDIDGTQRGSLTNMGAYQLIQRKTDVSMEDVQPSMSGIISANVPLRVRVRNIGTDTVRSMEIGYILNGVSGASYAWTGSVGSLDTVGVTIGSIRLKKGANTLTVYSYNPNKTADMNPSTDTLSVVVYGCDSALSGTYSVGTPTSDFPTLDEALNMAKYCGLNGPVVMELASGTYNSVIFRDYTLGSKKNTLTIRSADRNRNSVKISGSTAFQMDAVSHVILEDLTLDGSTIALDLKGTIENVEFRHCNLFGPEGVTNSSYRAVNYEGVSSSGKMLKDVRFIGNDVRGGYYNFYLYYFGSATGVMQSSSVTIDSNTIRGAYYHGVWSNYGQLASVSHNVITNGSNASTFNGIYLSNYTNALRIEGNLIHLNSGSSSYGIYVTSYINNVSYSSGPARIINNEIIVTGSSTKYGYYQSGTYNRINFVNNSVFAKGTSTSYAMYFSTSVTTTNAPVNIWNNQLINGYTSGYAIYRVDTCTMPTYGTRDYNNYYSSSSNLLRLKQTTQNTLAAIKNLSSKQDQHSMNTQPVWVHTNMSDLRLKNARVFQCPISYNVTENILGEPRVTPTVIGCYGIEPDSVDAGLVTFVGADAATSVGTHPIRVVVVNSGLKPIDSLTVQFSINGVAQTPVRYKPALPLAFRQTDTVNLGSFSFQTGSCTMKAFVQLAKDTNRTNDTITLTRNICTSVFKGIVTIGNNGDYTIATLPKLITDMANCGVGGDVILQVESGKYSVSTIDLSAFNSVMNGYHLTITSQAGHRDSVSVTASSGSLFTLNGNKNLTIRDLTLEAQSGDVIHFNGTSTTVCENINILHNHLIATLTGTSTSYNAIYKASASGFIKGARINGNIIEGGYYGIYLYGGTSTSEYGSDVEVDSNEIYNQYYYATYFYYTEFTSVSRNTMRPRTSGNINATWYGIRFYYCNAEEINGNYIDATVSASVTQPYGMYAYYVNYNNTKEHAQIANNVIKANTTGTYYGMNVNYSRVNVLHNSILMDGTGQGRALYYSTSTVYPMVIVGNQLITAANQYPIYAATSTAGSVTLDYNNYYGGGSYVGYFPSAGVTSLSSWQSATGMDAHSVSQPVSFVNTATGLKLNNYVDFLMPRMDEVLFDYEDSVRALITAMGAYTPEYNDLDASLMDFANTDLSNPSRISVEVTLFNMGKDTLKTATIHWSIDGVAQTPFAWKGSLPMMKQQVVTLGTAGVSAGAFHSIVAWVSNPNNGKDKNLLNDTVNMREYLCNGQFAGTYTVGGNNADFDNLQDAVTALRTCGISGPVSLTLATGTYSAVSINGQVKGASAKNQITVIPATGAKAVIDAPNGFALTLENTAHWNFRNLTIGNTKDGMIGVHMVGLLEDIHFRDCDIYASTTTTNSSYRAVDYPNSSSSSNYLKDVTFIHNNIVGGYYNMYIYYMSGSNGNMGSGSSMTVDSNTFREAYYYGIYAYYYAHFNSISYNTVHSRTNGTYLYGINLAQYVNIDQIEGNRIYSNTSSTSYGIYMSAYMNYGTYGGKPGVLKNNEVILLGSAGTRYGIMLSSPNQNWEIANNSIYAQNGSTNVYGLYISNSNSSYKVTAKNNLVVTKSTASTNYPVYLASYYTNSYVIMDYNNYYNQSGGNIGYAGSAISSLSSWKSTTGQEAHTTNIRPDFTDTTVNLRLNDYMSFLCPSLASTPVDIENNKRSSITTMGCYGESFYAGVNLQALAFASPQPIKDVICYADSTPVSVVIQNAGIQTADFSVSPLKVTVNVSGAISYRFDTTYTSGKLGMRDKDTLYLGLIPTIADGVYNIHVTLNDTSDTVVDDDTLSLAYNAYRVALPYDVNFTTAPREFINVTMAGETEWKVVSGAGSNPSLAPAFGTGRLEFAGEKDPGAYANAIFNAVNIQGCTKPTLSFWFAHNKECSGADMLTVLVTTDGGANYTEVKRILVADTATAWKQYDIDLTQFAQSSCLSIVFRAMSFGTTNQSIDRIRITAERDAAIELLPIDLSTRTACDATPVEIKAVIANKTRLNIDMTNDTIQLNVTGAVNYANSYVYNKILAAFESDTVTLGQVSIAANGNYYLEAYMQPRDDNASNDTLRDSSLYVYQDVSVDTVYGLDEQMTKLTGEMVNISLVARNRGNVPVTQMLVHMNLDGNKVVTDTLYVQMNPGDTLLHAMSVPFRVPSVSKDQPFYFLEVKAELSCDADNSNDAINIVGNVEIPDSIDIRVLGISVTSPALGKTKQNPVVRVANIGNMEADNIVLHVDVIDSGRVVESLTETINHLDINETKDHSFTMGYRVPNHNGTYTLKAYVEACAGDTVQTNDTLSVEFACTKDSTGIRDVERLDWSMGQNIPNPAASVTRIPYNVPRSGRIVFSVMSANGQLLHREVIEAEGGRSHVELQVEGYANGIYYYSMEYQGQRIVRKMSVTR